VGAAPEHCQGILLAVEKRKSEVYLPWFWRYIMLLIKLIPEWLFKKLSL
jgi:decaprenylphospho-beta-D-erythro-pentofuranosid-2-ulose 2-reductase